MSRCRCAAKRIRELFTEGFSVGLRDGLELGEGIERCGRRGGRRVMRHTFGCGGRIRGRRYGRSVLRHAPTKILQTDTHRFDQAHHGNESRVFGFAGLDVRDRLPVNPRHARISSLLGARCQFAAA